MLTAAFALWAKSCTGDSYGGCVGFARLLFVDSSVNVVCLICKIITRTFDIVVATGVIAKKRERY